MHKENCKCFRCFPRKKEEHPRWKNGVVEQRKNRKLICRGCDVIFSTRVSSEMSSRRYCYTCTHTRCVVCNKEFWFRYVKKQILCSRICTNKWRKGRKKTPEAIKRTADGHRGRKTGKYVICSFCKKETYKYPRTLKLNFSRMFCDSKCFISWTRTCDNPEWKGDACPENKRLRQSNRYKGWRRKVFERDNYTCQWCKIKGGKLSADHIKSWALFPTLRFELSNGRTLCIDCHKKTDTWGLKGKLQQKARSMPSYVSRFCPLIAR